MSKLRKKFITVLAVLFCALLALSVSFIIPKNKTAEADTLSTVVDLGDNGNFSAAGLRKLYGNITKSTDVITYEKLSGSLGTAQGTVLKKYSEMTPTTVSLGGLEWNVVSVSKNQKGEVIATLWISQGKYTTSFSDLSFTLNSYVSSGYLPASYGMSFVRATLVGGQYASSNTATKDGAQNEIWKTFLGNYGNYIDSPEEVCGTSGYQATEKAPNSNTSSSFLRPNEAYGDVGESTGSGNWYSNDVKNLIKITNYVQWKEDKLWLPSLSEVGINTTNSGLWGLNDTTVRSNTVISGVSSWMRSGFDGKNYSAVNVTAMPTSGTWNDNGNKPWCDTTSYDVKPALHLNLRAAAKAAKGISFDAVQLTNVEEGTNVAYDDSDGEHTFTTVYNTDDVKVKLLENDYLDVTEDYMGDNSTASIATFSGDTFSANKPKKDADETYILKVTPKTDPTDGKKYVWDGDDTSDPRYYKIKIKRTEMDVGWQGFNAQLGDNLLCPDSEITVTGNLADAQLEVRYYIVEPNSTNPPPTNTADWTLRGSVAEPTVNAAGTYVVHYEIKANYHNTVKSSYSVSVGVDNVTITADGSAGEAVYCTGGVENLTQQNWIDKIKTAITVTKNGQPYDSVDTLFENLEVVLKTKNGNSYSDAVKNGQECYDVGTYYLDLKFKNGASQAIQFSWANNDRPTLTINPAEIAVKVIADSEDGLTHVYGDNPAAMKFVLGNNTTALPDGGEVGDLDFGNYILQTDDGDIVLDNKTPVSEGVVIADTSKIKNYKIEFETSDSDYEVTQRTVKLIVADETAGYGTDFTKYKFKSLKFADGESLVNNEILSNVITSITYLIKSNTGASVKFSDDIYIGVYELSAKAEADNYIFEITAGKLTIEKGSFDMFDVSLPNAGYIYDGEPHEAQLDGELPSNEITVSYRYVNYNTNEELDGPPVEVGLYLVYATFTHENTNYSPITDVFAAYIRIAYTQEELNQAYPPLPTDEELAANADLAKKKADAKEELEKEAKDKKDAIDADLNLSAEEKAAAKSEVDKELADGKAEIDKAKDKDGIDSALSDGKKEIDDTADLAQKKGAAKSELDKAAQAKKDAIDANPELTDEEKAAAKAEVDKELADGKKAIDNANSLDGVDSAESSTKANIENIKPEHKGDFPWWILAVIAGALVLITLLIIIIVKRRNADDDDGYDDYYDDEYDYDEEEEIDDGDEAYGF